MAVDGNAVSKNALSQANTAVNIITKLFVSPQPIKTRLLHECLWQTPA